MNNLKEKIKEFYKNYNIDLDVTNVIDSYSVTRYFITLDRTNKTRLTNVEKLVDDLAVDLNIKKYKNVSWLYKWWSCIWNPQKDRKTLYFKDIDYALQDKKVYKFVLEKT